MNNSALFICKHREHPTNQHDYSSGDFSSGLFNSASYMVKMLNDNKIPSILVHVEDNNSIDREVTKHKPTHVFVEALWVVPDKFNVLQSLHPDVTWIIRIHSELPFIAGEGIAMEWLFKYIEHPNVYVAFNSSVIYNEFLTLIDHEQQDKVLFLPNHYSGERAEFEKIKTNLDVIDIGCFGAIRPLKNQLIQAVAAIQFAQTLNKKLRFHINGTRIEGKGDSVIKNIRNLFDNCPHCCLVEHKWMPHKEFVEIISQMDINMQVSLSETFNIVTADAVVNDVPVVVSKEINWISRLFQANPNSTNSIRFKLLVAYFLGWFGIHFINKIGLFFHNRKAERRWLRYIK